MENKLPPTIQHDPENKECHCNAYEGHPQCSFCTCSRQWNTLIPEQVKMLESEDRHTIELPRNYGKSMFTSPTGEKQDWEVRLGKIGLSEITNVQGVELQMFDIIVLKSFINFLRQEAKEEARREERHKIYGDVDPLESRKIENQIVIEQARLEVIAQVEEWWSNYKYKDEGGDYIWDDLLRFMRSLKTNSK